MGPSRNLSEFSKKSQCSDIPPYPAFIPLREILQFKGLRWSRTWPGNCDEKWLLFASWPNAFFPRSRPENWHHTSKIWLLSVDFIKKNEKFNAVNLLNFPFENETRFYFAFGFLENCRKDSNETLPNNSLGWELPAVKKATISAMGLWSRLLYQLLFHSFLLISLDSHDGLSCKLDESKELHKLDFLEFFWWTSLRPVPGYWGTKWKEILSENISVSVE